MARRYQNLSDEHITFIEHQRLFFIGTAANYGTINVSPKGFDSLKVLSPNRIVWLNITGSGNETAAHLAQNNRMTMMFSAFDNDPKILRLYGKARAIHPRDSEWEELSVMFAPYASASQFVDFEFDLVQTSCGFGVPLFKYVEARDNMPKWLATKNDAAIKDYWAAKNQVSLDGLPTHIFADDPNKEN